MSNNEELKTFRPIKGVIFDLDGLLLDSEPLYYQAAQEICQKYGKHYDDETKSKVSLILSIYRKVIGKAELVGAGIIVESLQLPMSAEVFCRILLISRNF